MGCLGQGLPGTGWLSTVSSFIVASLLSSLSVNHPDNPLLEIPSSPDPVAMQSYFFLDSWPLSYWGPPSSSS